MTTTRHAQQRRLTIFDRFAEAASEFASHAVFFIGCALIVLLWLPSYFLFGSLNTWQLIINTLTTIITFLLVAPPAELAAAKANKPFSRNSTHSPTDWRISWSRSEPTRATGSKATCVIYAPRPDSNRPVVSTAGSAAQGSFREHWRRRVSPPWFSTPIQLT